MPKYCLGVCAALCMATASTMCYATDDTQAAPEPKQVEAKATEVTEKFSKGNRLPHARLRFELTPLLGFDSGKRDRSGDTALRTSIDYEIPIVEHLTISPRAIPLMYYHQDDGGPVWIAGFGLVFRGYSNGKEQRGFFGEVGLHLLAQSTHFTGNSGTFNFMEEAGIGYMFEKGWHVAAKINHISNAGIAKENRGINNLGLGIGYSFKLH